MQRRLRHTTLIVAIALASAWSTAAFAGELSAALKDQLTTSKYVYIASQRKSGGFSKPAEIWFLFHDNAVWVGTPPTTFRAKRIKAGHTAAKIAVGKPDGPSFEAVGSIVQDPKVYELMFQTYAKKYPDGWSKFEQKFRDGFKDGSRVLIKYTPK
ncbi:MAG TPA: hypothetical protein VL403_14845 [Candidatus Kryptonia bacterium]|nr:hypothetical protein [Candidatus Kryptonia bacterium]